MEDPGTITAMLHQARNGGGGAVDRLFALLYDDLRLLAGSQLRGQPADRTINVTALIHEAYLRMVDQTSADWVDRAHFFAYAARAMRAVLIDSARRRGTRKRGRDFRHVTFDGNEIAIDEQANQMLDLDEALTRLGMLSDRLARTVEYRFFGGLTEAETAAVLGVSDRTVRRDWLKAKAWLRTELTAETST